MVEYLHPTTVIGIRVTDSYNASYARFVLEIDFWCLEQLFRYKLNSAIIITIASI